MACPDLSLACTGMESHEALHGAERACAPAGWQYADDSKSNRNLQLPKRALWGYGYPTVKLHAASLAIHKHPCQGQAVRCQPGNRQASLPRPK